jgi:hypothetical protein
MPPPNCPGQPTPITNPCRQRKHEALAIEAATFLKTKNVHAEVTVRDLETGETTAVKHLLQK